jgi:hypothetical protein
MGISLKEGPSGELDLAHEGAGISPPVQWNLITEYGIYQETRHVRTATGSRRLEGMA